MNFIEFKEKYENIPVDHYPNDVPEYPLVSVCVMTYQHAAFIDECLEGILMQKTNFPFEILLGEDASTDRTREICIEYAERFPKKIKLYLHHRENNIKIGGMPSGRFNLLYNIYSAKGKFITFCEGDDYWIDPHKLQLQYDILNKNSEVNLIFSNCRVKKEGHTDDFIPVNKISQGTHELIKIFKLRQWVTHVSTLMARSKDIVDFPKVFCEAYAGDNLILLHYIKEGRIYYLNKATSVYRKNKLSITNKYWKNNKTTIEHRVNESKSVVNTYPKYHSIFKRIELKYKILGIKLGGMQSFYKLSLKDVIYLIYTRDVELLTLWFKIQYFKFKESQFL